MLNLGVTVDLDVKKVKTPLHFVGKNLCVHCGSTSLIFIDKWGRETRKEVNAFDHIKCRSCGRVYSILWEKDENNNVVASAVSPSIIRDFKNITESNTGDYYLQ